MRLGGGGTQYGYKPANTNAETQNTVIANATMENTGTSSDGMLDASPST
jgi:hypothetical protein